jgi:glycosyltransferase involved in cell wall biosynthesis
MDYEGNAEDRGGIEGPVNRLRVAHVLEATVGGTRTHLNLIAEHLDRARFELVFFLSTRRDPDFMEDIVRFRERGIEVVEVDMCRAIHPVRDLRSFWRLYRAFQHSRLDLVHTHSSKAGILARLAARCARVPAVVHTPHVFAFEQTSNPMAKKVLIWIERIAARWTDRLVCVSEAERRTAIGAHLASPSQALTIPNAVHGPMQTSPAEGASLRAALRISPAAPVVATVAHFRKQKGLEDFVEVSSQVLCDHPSAVFLIIGAGDRAAIQRLIGARGLAESFRIVAARPPVWPYYSIMSVFALSSHWEGMPYALLEAMAMGCAVVTASVGGCAEVVSNGATGFLAPPGDTRSMAQAISLLLDNAPLRSALGSAARARITAEYRIESRIKELEAIYNSLCPQSTPSPFHHSAGR